MSKQTKPNPVVKMRLTGDLDKIQQLIKSLDGTIEIVSESKPYPLRNARGVRIYIETIVGD